MAAKMRADEVDIDESLVRRLLIRQFPQWADLPIEPVPSAGTVNAIYRLGDDMAVRLPRIQRYARDVEKESAASNGGPDSAIPRSAPWYPPPMGGVVPRWRRR